MWLFASAFYSLPLGSSHYRLYHQVNDNGLVSCYHYLARLMSNA